MAIQTSIPEILWLPGVDHYEISVYFSCNQSFIHDVKPSIQGVVSEHAFSINCTLYVNGNPYQRKIEDRLMVKEESEKRIQSFSFLPDALRREENCYLECSLTTMDGFFEKMPLSPPFWLKAWKEGSFFYYPAIPTHGVRASSLVPGKTRFCEQFPAITYEPTRDMTTALAIVNPRKRAIRVTVQMFPNPRDGTSTTLSCLPTWSGFFVCTNTLTFKDGKEIPESSCCQSTGRSSTPHI